MRVFVSERRAYIILTIYGLHAPSKLNLWQTKKLLHFGGIIHCQDLKTRVCIKTAFYCTFGYPEKIPTHYFKYLQLRLFWFQFAPFGGYFILLLFFCHQVHHLVLAVPGFKITTKEKLCLHLVFKRSQTYWHQGINLNQSAKSD